MSFNIKKMINFAYLCNYLFCMVTSYFQPFVYPLVDLSSRFSIPKMTFLAKCFTLPFKHPHLSFSIKYVKLFFSFFRQVILNQISNKKQLQIVNLIKNEEYLTFPILTPLSSYIPSLLAILKQA